jgi:hypothetical protein
VKSKNPEVRDQKSDIRKGERPEVGKNKGTGAGKTKRSEVRNRKDKIKGIY